MGEKTEKWAIIVALPVPFIGFKFFCPKCRTRYYLDEFGELVHDAERESFIHGPGEYKFPCETLECREEIKLKAIEIYC